MSQIYNIIENRKGKYLSRELLNMWGSKTTKLTYKNENINKIKKNLCL